MNSQAKFLIRNGYVDAAPATERVAALKQHGITYRHIAGLLGITEVRMQKLAHGRNKYIPGELLTRIEALDPTEILADMRPYVDDVLLDRIAAGQRVQIRRGEKNAYARALHTQYGWEPQRISTTMRMSHATTRQALSEVAA
ncbi:helix-turn-helix domain-containing protein [Nocardia elegans]|uniref:Helix-turn-helix domain-containing protein n=1 Tax=Nocardia elegans TaxID=300029 RepID=A0ABW6TPL2_9NOCA